MYIEDPKVARKLKRLDESIKDRMATISAPRERNYPATDSEWEFFVSAIRDINTMVTDRERLLFSVMNPREKAQRNAETHFTRR